MKRLMIISLALVASLAQGGVRPESLQLLSYEDAGDGARKSVYAVQCSNREEPLISSGEGLHRWCAEGSKQCFRDKIAAASYACELSQRERVAQGRSRLPAPEADQSM